MHGLSLVVDVARVEDGAQPVARLDVAVDPAAIRRRCGLETLERRMIRVVLQVQGVAGGDGLERGIGKPDPEPSAKPGRMLRTL